MLKNLKLYSRAIAIALIIPFVGIPILLGAYNLVSYFFVDSRSTEAVIIVENQKVYEEDLMNLRLPSQKIAFINEVVEKQIIDRAANDLHVGVASEEIKEEYLKKVNSAREKLGQRVGERELVRKFYKSTPSKLKSDITANLRRKKVEDIISANKKCSKSDAFRKWLEEEKRDISIQYLNDDFRAYGPQELFVINDLAIMNYDFASMLNLYMAYPQIMGGDAYGNIEEKAAKTIYESMSRDLLAAYISLERGNNSDLFGRAKINDLKKQLEDSIKDEMKIKKSQLTAFYRANLDKYIEKERAYVDVIFLPIKPLLSDIDKNNARAEKLLDQAIKDNELPKKHEVKTLPKKDFSKKYGRRYFRDNEVVPSLLLDGNIKIIAKERDGSIDYVELAPEISYESRKSILDRAADIEDKVTKGDLTIAKARELYSDVNFKDAKTIYRDGKFEKELENSVMKYDGLRKVETDRGIYLFQRTSYYPYKKPAFESVENRVTNEYKQFNLEREMDRLIRKSGIKNRVEILDPYFRSLIKG